MSTCNTNMQNFSNPVFCACSAFRSFAILVLPTRQFIFTGFWIPEDHLIFLFRILGTFAGERRIFPCLFCTSRWVDASQQDWQVARTTWERGFWSVCGVYYRWHTGWKSIVLLFCWVTGKFFSQPSCFVVKWRYKIDKEKYSLDSFHQKSLTIW